MKVIGNASEGKYIVEVSHSEIEKVFDKYYKNESIKRLVPGQELNLGEGHDFRGDIRSACQSLSDAMTSFDTKRKVLMNFAEMVLKLPEASE